MKRIISCLMLLACLPTGLMAAKVVAHMINDKDAPIPGVESKLVEITSGAEKYGTSSKSGEVVFTDVALGTYKLMGRKQGFAHGESKPVTVTGAEATVELKLLTEAEVAKMTDKASSAFKKKKYEEAAQGFEELRSYYPQDATILANLARCYQALNQSDKALELARQAVKLDPITFGSLEKDVIASATYNAGKKHLAVREFPQAIESFTESVKADATYAPAFYGLGLSYANSGKYPQALENVQQALKLEPNNQQYKAIEEQLKKVLGSGTK
jgi:tetratricopeptide (TPR) repeat protein